MQHPLYIEISPLLAEPLTGIGRFTARLVEALARVTPLCLFTTTPDGRPGSDYVSLTPNGVPPADQDLAAWARNLLHRPRAHTALAAPHDSPCLYTLLRPSERRFAREVSVLYDFTPLLLPWAHVEDTRARFGTLFSQVGRSDKAIAISHSTQADARWLCSLSPDDVVVAYPGASLCSRSHASSAIVARSTQLILVVSTLEPRKNGAFVQEWFRRTQVLAPDAELWWVGPQGWLWDRRVQGFRHRKVQFLGELPDGQLCELYRRATFTIYPSLYEGFGFPVLDSLLHGTPVVCSFNSSLKEFVGEGVFYFDPCEPASLDAACRDLLAREPLAVERKDLREHCSWDAMAATVLSLCA